MILKYLRYILKHKWFVFIACVRLGVPFRGLLHDLSKFRISEFIPYMRYFYGKYTLKDDMSAFQKSFMHVLTQEQVEKNFNLAWLLHLKRNPHHYQYWILNNDDGTITCLEMPEKYIREMVADWMGAGRAITGKDNLKEWFAKNKQNIISRMHGESVKILNTILKEVIA